MQTNLCRQLTWMLIMGALWQTQVFANVIPIPRYHVIAADQFCQGKGISATCTMPENAFGGGKGRCMPQAQPASAAQQQKPASGIVLLPHRIQPSHRLQCMPLNPPQIDAQITPVINTESILACGQKLAKTKASDVAETCPELLAPASDRFCRNKSAGHTCTVEEKTAETQIIQHKGTCRTQSIYYFHQPDRYDFFRNAVDFQRSETTCIPDNAVHHQYQSQ